VHANLKDIVDIFNANSLTNLLLRKKGIKGDLRVTMLAVIAGLLKSLNLPQPLFAKEGS